MTVRTGFNDRSGTITAGGTAQTIEAANGGRSYVLIVNIDAAEVLWVNIGAVAVSDQPSIPLAAGASLVYECGFVPSGLISVKAATTGHKFVCKVG